MKSRSSLWIFLLLVGSIFCCSKKTPAEPAPPVVPIAVNTPINGSRIAWDFTTLRKLAPVTSSGAGYARMIALKDHSLLLIYEASSGNIEVRNSPDGGISWTTPVTVAAAEGTVGMATPDILQLKNGDLLACYNPRPSGNNTDPTKRYAIRTRKSYDGGLSWIDERVLYQASYLSKDGCWEPSALQLPSGEIQLFFSNEGVYTTTNEQNISLLRSEDNGLTWTTTPQIVSFREGYRDGMPVPVLYDGGNEVAFSIEDNGMVNFKPAIIRSSAMDVWDGVVGGSSPNRNAALKDSLPSATYAGAPFLRVLPDGETILSYQSTEGRTGDNGVDVARMVTVIGETDVRNFNRATIPFVIPQGYSGLWNSLCVSDDSTVIALTSTNAYGSQQEVWMMKGHIIPELTASTASITVDGVLDENAWTGRFPVFIGHTSATQAAVSFRYDAQYLYAGARIKDATVFGNTGNPLLADGLTFYMDAQNKGFVTPGPGLVRVALGATGGVQVAQGGSGAWNAVSGNNGVLLSAKSSTTGYTLEVAIPWSLLGGKPALQTRMGVQVELREAVNTTGINYTEGIEPNNSLASYTWCKLSLQ